MSTDRLVGDSPMFTSVEVAGVTTDQICRKCGHKHRGGRPSDGTICDVQIRHAGADADQDAYCKCPKAEGQ